MNKLRPLNDANIKKDHLISVFFNWTCLYYSSYNETDMDKIVLHSKFKRKCFHLFFWKVSLQRCQKCSWDIDASFEFFNANKILPGSTLQGRFWARARAGSNHYQLVRPNSDGLYFISLFLRGCLVPAELFAALQHTVTRIQIIGHRLLTNHYVVFGFFLPRRDFNLRKIIV